MQVQHFMMFRCHYLVLICCNLLFSPNVKSTYLFDLFAEYVKFHNLCTRISNVYAYVCVYVIGTWVGYCALTLWVYAILSVSHCALTRVDARRYVTLCVRLHVFV